MLQLVCKCGSSVPCGKDPCMYPQANQPLSSFTLSTDDYRRGFEDGAKAMREADTAYLDKQATGFEKIAREYFEGGHSDQANRAIARASAISQEAKHIRALPLPKPKDKEKT